MSIEVRLERLERQNKWMRRMGAVALAGVACVLLMGQDVKFGEPFETHAIKVGTRFGYIRLDQDGLFIYDKNKEERLWLGVDDKNTAGMLVRDKNGDQRISLVAAPDGFANVIVADKNGKAALGSINAKKVLLVFYDKKGKPIWHEPKE